MKAAAASLVVAFGLVGHGAASTATHNTRATTSVTAPHPAAASAPLPTRSAGRGGAERPTGPPRPAPLLPMLARVSRVRVEAARDRIVVLVDVSLPRGEWQSGGLDPFVAFGAPGTPIAVDARLLPAPREAGDPRPDENGEAVTVDAVPRRPLASQALLGRTQMAGVVLHLKEAALRHVFSAGDTATLRIRTLLHPPSADAEGAHTLVVRLGIPGGLPLTLGRLQLVSTEADPWITRATAVLCGPEADPWPLSIAVVPRPPHSTGNAFTIAPEFAVRHESDDLCVRFWTTAP